MKTKQLIKSEELSLLISISRYTLRKMTREKIIPGYMINGIYFYDPDEVIDTLKRYGKMD